MSREEIPKDTTESLLMDEYEFGVGYGLRWLLYEYSDDGIDFHSACIDRLKLDGTEDILDVGCGNGGFLTKISDRNHQGKLIGTDFTSSLSYARTKDRKIHYFRASASVRPEQGSSQKGLPLKDNAFDIATALFMLYHVEDPRQTLRDLSRIVKTGGQIALATSGPSNKQEHRKIEAKIASSLGVDPPMLYAKKFTTDTAEQVLPEIFDNEPRIFKQKSTVTITGEHVEAFTRNNTYNVFAVYLDSLKSMNRHFGSIENRAKSLYKEIGAITLDHVSAQIDEVGYFQETIDRAFYVVDNTRS